MNGEGPILKVERLTKKFFVDPRLGRKPGYKDLIGLMLGLKLDSSILRENEFYAINNISFELHRGEAIGIMGLNGAGKSTLLKVLLGRLPLDSGRFNIQGSVGGLVELNAGFHREMTGLENVYNRARLLGKSDQEIKAKLDEIIEFADLGEFINSPVKTYSSGMNVRLGFSIAIHFVDDLVLFDEVLAVGDFDFRQKCLSKINELRRVKSFVLVSHSNGDIARFCDKAIILHKGEVVFSGRPTTAIEAYAQCSHHLSSQEVKNRIEKSLSLQMKGEGSTKRSVEIPSRMYFFKNIDFKNGLDGWEMPASSTKFISSGDKCGFVKPNGAFSVSQSIDRECRVRVTGELTVNSGEVELIARENDRNRLVKSWKTGYAGEIDLAFNTSCIMFRGKEIDKFPGGLSFSLRKFDLEHDVEIEIEDEQAVVLDDGAKLSVFGPEFHQKDVVSDVSLEWNLRRREQGFYYVSGDYFVFKVCYTLNRNVSSLRIGIPFFKEDGQMILGPDSRNYGKNDKLRLAGKHELFMVIDPLPVNVGRFWFALTLCEDPAHLFRKHITHFDVINPAHEYGLVKSFPVWTEEWRMENANKIYGMK